MAISFRTGSGSSVNSGFTGVTSQALTLSSSIVAGDLVMAVVAAGSPGGTPSTVGLSGGGITTWTSAGTIPVGGGSGFGTDVNVGVYTGIATASTPGGTVTGTSTVSSQTMIAAASWPGAGGVDVFATPTAITSSSGATTLAEPSLTTMASGVWLIDILVLWTISTATLTPSYPADAATARISTGSTFYEELTISDSNGPVTTGSHGNGTWSWTGAAAGSGITLTLLPVAGFAGAGMTVQPGGQAWRRQFRRAQNQMRLTPPLAGTSILDEAGSTPLLDESGGAPLLDEASVSSVWWGPETVAGAGSLIAGSTIAPATPLDAAGSLIAGGTFPSAAALDAAGSVVTGGTITSGAPVDAAGSLASTGSAFTVSLLGTGSLIPASTEAAGAALDGAGALITDASLASGSVMDAAGTLLATPGTSGGAALNAAGVLSTQTVLGQSAPLTGTGSLIPASTQAAGAALDAAGTLAGVGLTIGALVAGRGSVIAASTAGVTTLLTGAGALLTASVQSPALEAYNFGTFPQIPAGSAISSVSVVVNDWSSTSAMNAITFELWDGTSARIGTTQVGTPSTSPYNLDSATFTGVSYSQLATLRVRLYANAGSSNSGDQEFAGSVSLTVAFTPAANAAATTTTLKQATVFPAVTVTGSHNATVGSPGATPAATVFPAVTAGQVSINELASILRAATVFPAVTAFGTVNASITAATLACTGSVVASIVTATATGPDYATAAGIQAGIGTAAGTWTSTAGVIGPPDANEAVWTRP